MSSGKAFRLDCAVQQYGWGKLGIDSEVAKLSQTGNTSFILEQDTPYAELWMGTHPKGPSVISSSSVALSRWLADHPDAVGEKVTKRFPQLGQLPFLFKVLSVNKSLSIQAHPNKSHAEQLHRDRPDKYPDSNHKPEMAIALTPFEGLCGFRPKNEIVNFMKLIPEFREVVGDDKALALEVAPPGSEDEIDALRGCFSALMTSDPDIVTKLVEKLASRLKNMENAGSGDLAISEGELFLRLNGQFPGDCGCFCIYFLNHMMLQPGEAMFLEANLPHAYLAGDCMECMACSDNVVRAGLTPKFKDVPTLCSMLNYTCKPAKENLYASRPDADDQYVTVYNPPVEDFGVNRIQVPSGVLSYSLSALHSASICLVIRGEALVSGSQSLRLTRGSVLFVSAEESVSLALESEGIVIFQAYCSL